MSKQYIVTETKYHKPNCIHAYLKLKKKYIYHSTVLMEMSLSQFS